MTLSPEEQQAISEEERTLESVLTSLHAQRERYQNRLKSESDRARELTSDLVAARRLEDKAMLASDEAVSHALRDQKEIEVAALDKVLKSPYFARIIVEEEKNGKPVTFEYRIGQVANSDTRIIDWRKAPISKLFYNYREGDDYSEEIQGIERTGEILLRNTVEIVNQELKRLSCRFGDFVKRNGIWEKVSNAKVRGESTTYGQLPDVLSLITADQFKTITEDAETAILVQGIAGSGKTTVALYRLAWLLHEDNSPLLEKESLVVVLSLPLKNYIKNTLKSLQIGGVNVLTYSEWSALTVAQLLPEFVESSNGGGAKLVRMPRSPSPSGFDRVRRSMATLLHLEEELERERNDLYRSIENEIVWGDLPSGLERLFEEGKRKSIAIVPFLNRLIDGTKAALSVAANSFRYPSIKAASDLFGRELEKAINIQGLLTRLFARPQNILRHDETKLLDEELVRRTGERLRENLANHTLDASDLGLVMRISQLRFGGVYTEPNALGVYKHLVIDEVQDLSPTELAAAVTAVSDIKNLTIVGDVAQSIDGTSGFPGWEKLRRYWNFHDAISKFIQLEVSHRSTLPIMKLADFVQGRESVKGGRPGRVPIWFKCKNEKRGVGAVIDWLNIALERFPTALTAVICKDYQEARFAYSLLRPTFSETVRLSDDSSFSFDEGIIVTEIKQVKGLEFQNVLLWNPSRKAYPDDSLNRNLLYTAITRAEENLCLVSWENLSPLLPRGKSPLLRLHDLTEEEEEPAPSEPENPYANFKD